MTVEAHLVALRTRLVDDAAIVSYEIIREQFVASIGQIRARLRFYDDSWMEFSEVVRQEANGAVSVISYSYQWMNKGNTLRKRWDDAPHYPNLAGFPYHVHDSDEKDVTPSEPMNLFKVLDLIAAELDQ